LVIDQELLMNCSIDDATAKKVLQAYGGGPHEGVYIWVDDMPETDVSMRTLEAYAELCRKLQSDEKRVVTLYGGYFSTALAGLTGGGVLSGACHGLEYGEDRGVVPVGGGLPMSKFYMPHMHRRVPFRDAVRLIAHIGGFDGAQDYFDKVCDCEACREVISADPEREFQAYGVTKPVSFRRGGQVVTLDYPTPPTKDLCVRHYLHCKAREFHGVCEDSPANIVGGLRAAHDSVRQVIGADEAAYLKSWATILERYAMSDNPAA
jgi:hypothetical protein